MYSILIIDGDGVLRIELKQHLKKRGYKVYSSDRLRAGIQKARQKLPDLIICELDFADGDGFEFIKEVKADAAMNCVRIIVLSSRNNDLDKVLALEMGADDYIVKPVGPVELSARIKCQFRYERMDLRKK